MATYRWAQPMYGKIIYIYETDIDNKGDLAKIFDPSTQWFDATGTDIEVGYVQQFDENTGVLNWVKPKKEEQTEEETLEQAKKHKIDYFKKLRDKKEREPITTDKGTFDYDTIDKSRINDAIEAAPLLGLTEQLWSMYDNTHVLVTVDDLKNVIAMGTKRMAELHFKYGALKEQVNACTTVEEVGAITWI